MNLFTRDNFTLLRIPFSIFLMPIYWFAISQFEHVYFFKAFIAFVVLHLFIYPASNGYNSYMDKDTDSIGGLEKPPMSGVGLLYLTIIFNVIGLIIAAFISTKFLVFVAVYILVSKAYSYRRIRLKKYPFLGFITVAVFQGGFTYLMVQSVFDTPIDLLILFQPFALLSSSFLIAGAYPLTQIYQHKQDSESGDITISQVLGIKGTILFSSVFFVLSNVTLFIHFTSLNHFSHFIIFQLCLLPVAVYYVWWAIQIWDNPKNANYKYTMRMNTISSLMMSICFVSITILNN